MTAVISGTSRVPESEPRKALTRLQNGLALVLNALATRVSSDSVPNPAFVEFSNLKVGCVLLTGHEDQLLGSSKIEFSDHPAKF